MAPAAGDIHAGRGHWQMSSSLRSMYKSLTAQTLHYFARPHEAPRRTPIDGPAAWRGGDLATSTAWRHRLSAADIAELDRALAGVKASGRPLRALRAADLPLPALTGKIAAWR